MNIENEKILKIFETDKITYIINSFLHLLEQNQEVKIIVLVTDKNTKIEGVTNKKKQVL